MTQHPMVRKLGILAGAGLALAACTVDPSSAAEDPDRVLAVVGDEKITVADIEPAVGAQLMKVRREQYQVEKQGLDAVLFDKLLEIEAKAQETTPEALFESQVQAKVTAVTDEEVEQFYEQNKARLRGRSRDQALPQIRAYLGNDRLNEARQEYYETLKGKHKVRVLLSEPTVSVSVDDDPFKGPEDAPVTIVEFSDFQCPFCGRVTPTLEQIFTKYGDKVKVVFRDFPLNFHQQAQKAAEAAECAHEQGRFWDYHDTLFANQSKLAADDLKAHAATLGLDEEQFAECLDSNRYAAEVQADMADGQRAGVTGTPAFFINGRFLNGARPFEDFAQIIDEELVRAAN